MKLMNDSIAITPTKDIILAEEDIVKEIEKVVVLSKVDSGKEANSSIRYFQVSEAINIVMKH